MAEVLEQQGESPEAELEEPRFGWFRVLLLMLLLVAAVGAILLASARNPFGVSDAETELEVTQQVAVDEMVFVDGYTLSRRFLGEVEASQSASLAFELGGMLNEILVDEGDVVSAGQLLASLDSARLQASLQEAKASLAAAQVDVELTASTLERFEKAFASRAISSQELDEARTNQQRAEAAAAVAQSRVQRLQVDLGKLQLSAPFAGTITRRNRDLGSVVGAGEAVFVLQQTQAPEVRFGLPPRLLEGRNSQEPVELLIEGKSYSALQKAQLPQLSDNQTTEVIFALTPREDATEQAADEAKEAVQQPSLANPQDGEIAFLTLEEPREEQGVWLPLSALKEGQRGLWSVFVAESAGEARPYSAQRRTVEVIYLQDQRAFVRGAIKQGELVVVEGAQKLVPGQQLQFELPAEAETPADDS